MKPRLVLVPTRPAPPPGPLPPKHPPEPALAPPLPNPPAWAQQLAENLNRNVQNDVLTS